MAARSTELAAALEQARTILGRICRRHHLLHQALLRLTQAVES